MAQASPIVKKSDHIYFCRLKSIFGLIMAIQKFLLLKISCTQDFATVSKCYKNILHLKKL
jgi:hypothetical protein